MQYITTIVCSLLTFYLIVQVGYLFIFSLAGSLGKRRKWGAAKQLRSIRIFMPGYREDAVILASAQAALQQNYPADKYEVVVIADSFSAATLAALRSLPIRVVEVSFEKSTKGKALHKALEATAHEPLDIALILDADNLMAEGFLHAVNDAFEAGYSVVQGHRTAKNTNTPFALLDACTEEINNHIFRRGHVAAGLPSALIGSGMAFGYGLFESLLHNIGDTAGEDKEIEFRLMRIRKNIAFLDGHFVYDEKVANTAVFGKQRSRWLGAQLEFLEAYGMEGFRQLLRGNIAFFDKALQMFLLPRVMLAGFVFLWLLCTFLFVPGFLSSAALLTISLMISLCLGIPRRWYNRQLIAALLHIPGALLAMMVALAQSGKARKNFIHTPHGEVTQVNH